MGGVSKGTSEEAGHMMRARDRVLLPVHHLREDRNRAEEARDEFHMSFAG